MFLATAAGPAFAETYRWVDAGGEVHFTDDPNTIPEQYRPRGNAAPPAKGSAASPAPGGQPGGTSPDRVALWLRTGGLRGEGTPVLIQTYDSLEACNAERDRRAKVHASQGMQSTSQPGLAISNLGGSVAGTNYFAYSCVPAAIRRP